MLFEFNIEYFLDLRIYLPKKSPNYLRGLGDVVQSGLATDSRYLPVGTLARPLESATVAAVARRCRRSLLVLLAPGPDGRLSDSSNFKFALAMVSFPAVWAVILMSRWLLQRRWKLVSGWLGVPIIVSTLAAVVLLFPEPIQLANRTPTGRGLSLGRLVFRVVLWSVRDFVDLADIVVDLAHRPPRRRRDSPPPVLHHSQCRLMPWM